MAKTKLAYEVTIMLEGVKLDSEGGITDHVSQDEHLIAQVGTLKEAKAIYQVQKAAGELLSVLRDWLHVYQTDDRPERFHVISGPIVDRVQQAIAHAEDNND